MRLKTLLIQTDLETTSTRLGRLLKANCYTDTFSFVIDNRSGIKILHNTVAVTLYLLYGEKGASSDPVKTKNCAFLLLW